MHDQNETVVSGATDAFGLSARARGRTHRLEEVLLDYLQTAPFPWWPGADGLTVQDGLRSYPSALALGLVPGPEALRRLHPDLAEAVLAYFEHGVS